MGLLRDGAWSVRTCNHAWRLRLRRRGGLRGRCGARQGGRGHCARGRAGRRRRSHGGSAACREREGDSGYEETRAHQWPFRGVLTGGGPQDETPACDYWLPSRCYALMLWVQGACPAMEGGSFAARRRTCLHPAWAAVLVAEPETELGDT
ncbi:hypothetical protein DMB42_29225 [Nonomuraea sp. WAC 01424]|nr:hypothetical protein DMB42_29225 [Nonomuraea sp. WAC 01424]